MSAQDQPLKKAQGVPLPQFFNKDGNFYEEQTGRDGAAWYHQRGTVVKDSIIGSANVTKTYNSSMYGFGIVNDASRDDTGASDLTFTIGGLTIVVKPRESFDNLFTPFTSVSITATKPFRAVVRE